MTYRRWHYAGRPIHVSTEDPRTLAWLEDYLSFAFSRRSVRPGGTRISIEADAALFDTLSAGAAQAGEPLDAFTLDRHMVALPTYRCASGNIIACDSPLRAVYIIDSSRGRVRIVGAPGAWEPRLGLLRVIREYATNRALLDGAAPLHAAAFAIGRRTYAILGPKRTGKTTLLLSLLCHGGARFVSNDRVTVWPTASGATLRAMPTIVSLRRTSAEYFPRLAVQARGLACHPLLTRAERGHVSLGGQGRRGRVSLSPADFRELVGSEGCAGGPLRAVLFPLITRRPGTLIVEQLDAANAEARLRRSLIGPFRARKMSSLFVPASLRGRTPRWEDLEALCQHVARTVPAYLVHLGLDAHRHASAVRALVRRVTSET